MLSTGAHRFLYLLFLVTTSLAGPAINETDYLDLLKYEGQLEDVNVTLGDISEQWTTVNESDQTSPFYRTNDQQQNLSDLYTVQLTHQSQRQLKHHDAEMVYDYKCPKQHYIHPCDCLDKRAEMFEGSGDMPDAPNSTPTMEVIQEEPIHPDLIETVAFCKNIRNVQVLTEAVRGFQGHRINYFVLDGCKLPSFPNNLFKDIHIVWMEILNSTLQFHDNFFQSKSCP